MALHRQELSLVSSAFALILSLCSIVVDLLCLASIAGAMEMVLDVSSLDGNKILDSLSGDGFIYLLSYFPQNITREEYLKHIFIIFFSCLDGK